MFEKIAAFRPGKHRASSGKVFEFTEAEVRAIAAAYDPALHAAPFVLGHPKSDAPAWGWAKGLSVDEAGVMFVEGEQVDPAFAEGVTAGRYRFVSSAFYAPDDAANPKPGGYYLRHLGFLGAQPPAIKGLSPAFGEGDGEDFIEFADREFIGLARTVAGAFRGLRDFLIAEFGQEKADKALPPWNDQYATELAAEAAADLPLGVAYEEGADPLAEKRQQLDARAAELDGRAAALESREAAFAEQEAQARTQQAQFAEAARATARAEDEIYVDGLVAAGRLPPARRDGVLALFSVAAGDAGVTFAEGVEDGRAALRNLLDGLGTEIHFGERAAHDGFEGHADPQAVAGEIRRIQAAAAAEGEPLSASQAAARIGR